MTTVAAFYAPQARLIDVATNDIVGGRAPSGSEHVDLDLVSARVTLQHSNVSQVTIVLNNQLFDGEGLPTAPPWKYNGLDRIKFGQRIRLDMRYGDQPWTKMILAQVNDLQFTFAASGPAQVTITGEDLLCLLKRSPKADVAFDDGMSEEQIAEKTINAGIKGGTSGITVTVPVGKTAPVEPPSAGVVTVRGGLVDWPARSLGLPPQRHTKGQTYVQFLQQIMERMDLELFIDFLHNYLPDTDPGVTSGSSSSPPAGDESNDQVIHFEPARSWIPKEANRRVVELMWGVDLLDFTPKLKVWDMADSVRVKGRPRKSSTPIDHTIEGAEADSIVDKDLAHDGTDPAPWSATRARRELLGANALPTQKPVEFANLDEERAMIKARKVLIDASREILTAEATTIGFPTLRPGLHVKLRGLYPPFDGIYYVTKTVHSFDGTGYRTQMSLRRPGMLPPDEYPKSLAAQNKAAKGATS